uniref:Uncharacterized protein n=1 Tax=Phlebotomus papatasi TaxID=29031 RepID=A0A1B0DL17_PHLPP
MGLFNCQLDDDDHITGYLEEFDEQGNQYLVIMCEGVQIARIPAGRKGLSHWKWLKV